MDNKQLKLDLPPILNIVLPKPKLLNMPIRPQTTKLTENEQRVLEYLKGKDFISPTQIASALTLQDYNSAWASPICKRLINKGLLQRNDRGWYRNPER